MIDILALHQVIKGEFENAEIIVVDIGPAAGDIDPHGLQRCPAPAKFGARGVGETLVGGALPFVIALSGPAGRRARPIFAAACALTFLIYPLMFLTALVPMRMTAILVLNLRNAMVVALWAILAFGADEDRGAIDAG